MNKVNQYAAEDAVVIYDPNIQKNSPYFLKDSRQSNYMMIDDEDKGNEGICKIIKYKKLKLYIYIIIII